MRHCNASGNCGPTRAKLERWWGPPTAPATFEHHELEPGGTVRGAAEGMQPLAGYSGGVSLGGGRWCDGRVVACDGVGDVAGVVLDPAEQCRAAGVLPRQAEEVQAR